MVLNPDAVIDGSPTVVAEGTVQYDVRGNVTKRYAPFSGSTTTFRPTPPTGTGVTGYTYDPLNRVTRVDNPDGSFRTMDYSIAWQTTTKDECYTATTCPGSRAVEIRDAFGRVVEKQLYTGTASGDTFDSRTGYVYDALGRLTITKQGATATTWQTASPDTQIITTYDSLGRKIQLQDPDTGPSSGPGIWEYGYDLAGNLIFQDDPRTGQREEFCYDWLNRVTGKYYPNDTQPLLINCQTTVKDIAYQYDQGGGYPLGHLTSVSDQSGSTANSGASVFTYDVRGRLATQQKTISYGTTSPMAGFTYTYDVADHPKTIVYPDNETVTYTYDAAGQTQTMAGTSTYVSNLKYDIFGRPSTIAHGNATTDTRTYWDKSKNYRLSTMVAQQQGNPTAHLNLNYADYWANGLLKTLTDNGPKGTNNVLDNSAAFGYDGLGRLKLVTGTNFTNNSYQYDALGNMTVKESVALFPTANTVKPHQPTLSGVTHDDDGNRKTKTGQTYTFNGDDRLTNVSVPGTGSVTFAYDYTGKQTLRDTGSTVTRYFSELAESGSDGYLTKHYFAAGLRIASRRVSAPQFAGLPASPAVMMAQVSPGHAAVVLLLRRDVQSGVLLSVAVLSTGLLLAPWRRKRVVGIAVRHGHVIGVLIGFSFATLPLPLVMKSAEAQTPPALYHWHLDHLGSTQAVSDGSGNVLEHIRYSPYGTVRSRYSSSTVYRYEFTGYESEAASNLAYAGARFYDPALGSFLTHDPKRQFANPYTYTNWDPTNLTDPSGAELIAIGFAIAIALGVAGVASSIAFTTTYAQARMNGATNNQALSAAAKSGAITAGLAAGLYLVGWAAPVLQPVIAASSTAYGTYTAVEAFRTGQYASAGVGVGLLAFGLYEYGQQAETALGVEPDASTPALQIGLDRIALGAKVVATDVYSLVVGQLIGQPATLLSDFGKLGTEITKGKLSGFAKQLGATAFHLLIPKYAWYLGAGYGVDQWGRLGVHPAPTNSDDWVSWWHDLRYDHFEWVRNTWMGQPGVLPTGPIGVGIRILGTPTFALAGVAQQAGIGPVPNVQ